MRGCSAGGERVQRSATLLAMMVLDCTEVPCVSLNGASLNGASLNGASLNGGSLDGEDSCLVQPMPRHCRLELGPKRSVSLRLFLSVALQCLDRLLEDDERWLVSVDQIQFPLNMSRVWVRIADDHGYWKRPEEEGEEERLIAAKAVLLELAQMGGVNQTGGFGAAPDYQQENFTQWLKDASALDNMHAGLLRCFWEQISAANYRTDDNSFPKFDEEICCISSYNNQHWCGICRPMLERYPWPSELVGVARVSPGLYRCERCEPRVLPNLAMPGSLTSGWAPPGSWVADAWRKEIEFAATGVRQQAMHAAVGLAKLPWAATWNATTGHWRDTPDAETRVCNAVDERIRLHTVVSLRNLLANHRLTRPLVDSLQRDARTYCKRAARIARKHGIRPNTGWFVGCYDQAYVTLEIGVPNHRLIDRLRGRPRPVGIKSKLRLLLTPDCLKAPTEEEAENREAAFFRKVRHDAGCRDQIPFREQVHFLNRQP
ncbi:hypothetical protein GNI_182640 [Gregarina niphandrodes]|uniref:Uncharacterized protein n=1 Tax=Gregarina niphandrodes TaxID=110365 RepID=A0A023AWV8_GRENI|nr:hypothetical protein GNI_182640 [Gregarina niphandrodes]EZG43204.1 hypothetical protein GNI_182640 [Gregarina niphandrodes]|eukprot:XP_011133535.1 hypothetical protein GNI_182640 [Gregarina niphandrodes]